MAVRAPGVQQRGQQKDGQWKRDSGVAGACRVAAHCRRRRRHVLEAPCKCLPPSPGAPLLAWPASSHRHATVNGAFGTPRSPDDGVVPAGSSLLLARSWARVTCISAAPFNPRPVQSAVSSPPRPPSRCATLGLPALRANERTWTALWCLREPAHGAPVLWGARAGCAPRCPAAGGGRPPTPPLLSPAPFDVTAERLLAKQTLLLTGMQAHDPSRRRASGGRSRQPRSQH